MEAARKLPEGGDILKGKDEIRTKRLRYVFIPDMYRSKEQVQEYYDKLERFISIFRDKLFKGECIEVKYDQHTKTDLGTEDVHSNPEAAVQDQERFKQLNNIPAFEASDEMDVGERERGGEEEGEGGGEGEGKGEGGGEGE